MQTFPKAAKGTAVGAILGTVVRCELPVEFIALPDPKPLQHQAPAAAEARLMTSTRKVRSCMGGG
jgi:hypothetical protein